MACFGFICSFSICLFISVLDSLLISDLCVILLSVRSDHLGPFCVTAPIHTQQQKRDFALHFAPQSILFWRSRVFRNTYFYYYSNSHVDYLSSIDLIQERLVFAARHRRPNPANAGCHSAQKTAVSWDLLLAVVTDLNGV